MMKRQQQPVSPKSAQSGFTIIESLLAIVIVSALMVAIAPVIVLSVATRVQARRVELATQVARSYVDGVRSGAIQTPNSVIVPVIRPNDPVPKFLNAMPAPANTLASCAPNPTATSSNFYCDAPPAKRPNPNLTGNLYCFNLDSNPDGCSTRNPKSFIVQSFRTVASNPRVPTLPDYSDDGSKGYVLGVRVYRAEAFDGVGTLQASAPLLGGRKARTYTGGTGDKKSPLVELTTEVRGANANDETNYNDLCQRLGGCQ